MSLEGLLDIKAKHNAAKLVVGNTEVGIELKFKHAGYPVLVGTTHVPELNTIEVSRASIAYHVWIVAWNVRQLAWFGRCSCPVHL